MAKDIVNKPVSKNTPTPIPSREYAESDALLASMGEGVIVTDEKGNISKINPVASEILGLPEKEAIGEWYPGKVIAEDENGQVVPRIERPITQMFLSGKSIFRRLYLRRMDGSRVPVAVTVSPVMQHGRPVGAIEVFRDITDEIELEHAKDEFISIASHQLRTPATVVKQYIGMMIDGYMGSFTKQQKEMLQTAYDYNDNQLKIINDLLRVAQADANKIRANNQLVDMVALIESVVVSQKSAYKKKRLSLKMRQNTEKVVVKVDPLHIRMVVENLLDNAQKYSQPGGGVLLNLEEEDKCIKISVTDNGIGIDPKDIPKLFQKFSRINNPESTASGTGLGLYWAMKLIKLHKGSIRVKSELGKGTTFIIRLPKGNI